MGFFTLAFDLPMYRNFMVSCNRKPKPQFSSTMFNNISVVGDTDHANVGAVMLFASRQLEFCLIKNLLKNYFKYTIKICKTV